MYTRKTPPTPTSCIVLNECEHDTTWIYAWKREDLTNMKHNKKFMVMLMDTNLNSLKTCEMLKKGYKYVKEMGPKYTSVGAHNNQCSLMESFIVLFLLFFLNITMYKNKFPSSFVKGHQMGTSKVGQCTWNGNMTPRGARIRMRGPPSQRAPEEMRGSWIGRKGVSFKGSN